MVEKLRAVYRVLGAHPGMEPNLTQTFSTPANRKNKVYFMWDFVGRTLHTAYLTPASMNDLSQQEKNCWADVQGRARMIRSLLLDEMPGMLDMMVGQGTPGSGQNLELGEEVRQAAAQLG